MTRELIIVREAENESGASIAMGNPFAIRLTALGHTQAVIAASALSKTPDLIVSSPMFLAKQTTRYFRARFPLTPFEPWAVSEFVFLKAVGELWKTPEQIRPRIEAYWRRCDPDEINAGWDCESFRSLLRRVRVFHDQVACHQSEVLLVISHGLFMHVFCHMVEHDFPPCAPELMAEIYLGIQRNPIANCQVICFETEWCPRRGRPKLSKKVDSSYDH